MMSRTTCCLVLAASCLRVNSGLREIRGSLGGKDVRTALKPRRPTSTILLTLQRTDVAHNLFSFHLHCTHHHCPEAKVRESELQETR